ncbi:MAG: hypothetical protein HS115_15975 [Spirochaetales bacterium]|nr:hypothetical protein [Spirochaetales bacterium]
MAVLRVTLVQKNPANPPTEEQSRRLSREKTDFIVFAATGGDAPQALDWLHRLSDSTSAIVIGGLLPGNKGSSCPILLDGALIDSVPELPARDSADPIFILKGQRFAALPGKSALSVDSFAALAREKIRLVICPVLATVNDPLNNPEHFQKMARDHSMVIIKCAGCGSQDGQELYGQSLIAAPSGISWRVSGQESQREIVKTLSVQPPAE